MCLRPTFYCLKDLLEPIIAPKLLKEPSILFNMLSLVQGQVSSAYKDHPSPGKNPFALEAPSRLSFESFLGGQEHIRNSGNPNHCMFPWRVCAGFLSRPDLLLELLV